MGIIHARRRCQRILFRQTKACIVKQLGQQQRRVFVQFHLGAEGGHGLQLLLQRQVALGQAGRPLLRQAELLLQFLDAAVQVGFREILVHKPGSPFPF